MKITVKVDPDLCIGAAACVTISPDLFQMNDENKAEMDGQYERELEVDQAQLDEIILSAQSCPTLAIFVYNEEGEEIFPAM